MNEDDEVDVNEDDDESATDTEYRVTWETDVTATSPEEAAREALRIQRNPQSTATVFGVSRVFVDSGEWVDAGEDDTEWTIDLDELERCSTSVE